MTLTGLLVDTGTVATDFFGLAAMALIGRNETNTAVAVRNLSGNEPDQLCTPSRPKHTAKLRFL